ncbi:MULTISPECIES: hypothetical protein [Crocosphaera]|uniref:Lipoprotein n=3 Tax=Crocosphaera watsonii TaxID=263511 RepID=G5J6Y4_CROWT|nr:MULTISPECIES: hypothetical protein [Crocosphaera]EHJ12051.1 hypothetical protein CWATWH0003_3226 [Crocosphaera watsonii WH 0003]MCH2248116.1 hypothetical protein [Crocosphaera sp.]CCQ57769.1 hypothetical protein CWATWH0005_2358 [Crocosphaera watsonii WH 0005]
MKTIKLGLLCFGSMGLFFLVGCTNPTVTSDESMGSNSATISEENHSEHDSHDHSHDHGKHSQSEQVIKSGEYTLKLVTVPSDKGVHIAFYLLEGEANKQVKTAQVQGQLQLPNGEQKAIPLNYEAERNHYHGMLSELNGEKINGKFSFQR